MKKQILIIILIIINTLIANLNAMGQWNTFGGNNITSVEYLGGDGTSTIPLNLKTITGYPINIYTANILRMTILGSTNPGFVGIGSFTPSYKLDVDSGDININFPTNGYRITSTAFGSQFVLRNNNIPTSIYVGVGAGNAATYTNANTFVGYNAGVLNGSHMNSYNSGNHNTFVGHLAGASNDEGFLNSFFGDSAGYHNIGNGASNGYHNTFIGCSSGFSNISGKSSTFVGMDAGHNSLGNYNTMVGRNCGYFNDGERNSFYGKDAGYFNRGSENSFYGYHSGGNYHNVQNSPGPFDNSFYGTNSGLFFHSGSYNCLFGQQAGVSLMEGDSNVFIGDFTQSNFVDTLINNSVDIGFGTNAITDNKFILGNNLHNVGIGLSDDNVFGGPRSRLEINGDSLSRSYTGIGGSGLRFRQLISTSTLGSANYIAPYGRVLTVDANGIVKLTDGGGLAYSQCGGTLEALSANSGIDLNDNTIFYKGNNYNSGNSDDVPNSIGLGYACGDPLRGKLSVYQHATTLDEETAAGYFQNSDETSGGSNFFVKRGIWVVCNGLSDNPFNVGGDFFADSSSYANVGVKGFAGNYTQDLYEENNYGGVFAGSYGEQNIGVSALTFGGGSVNYGLTAYAPLGTCSTGVCYNAAGYFTGDIFHSAGFFGPSDRNLKENIQPLKNSLEVIYSLEPKSFNFRLNQYPFLNLPTGTQEGLIAQEVERVLPELVKNFSVPSRPDRLGNIDSTGVGISFKAIDYVAIIPFLIGAIKEQQQSIDSLRNQIMETQKQIDKCCGYGLRIQGKGNNSLNPNDPSTIDVQLSNANVIILDQNSPNPFSEETFINYTIPKEVSKAVIMIYDNLGQVLKSVIINERGQGSLHIYAEKLSSGIYTYSLLADGKTIDTKQMVYQK